MSTSPFPLSPTDQDIDLSSIHRAVQSSHLQQTDTRLSPREIDVVLGRFRQRFDAKRVASFRQRFMLVAGVRGQPHPTYFEELFLPRYGSFQRLAASPVIFACLNAVFGASYATWTNQKPAPTMWRYFKGGLLLGIPYYVCNEVITGLLVRRNGREQYFYSHSLSGLLMGLGYLGINAARKSSSD